MLTLHHRRMDDMLEQVQLAAAIERWDRARAGLGELRAELDDHIRVEETVLFPAFDAFPRTIPGATAVMRAEHREIRRLMDILDALLNSEQPLRDAIARLTTALAIHNLKEEHVVYPAFDQHGELDEKLALLRELSPLFEA